jgi:putative MATE family efflux protein
MPRMTSSRQGALAQSPSLQGFPRPTSGIKRDLTHDSITLHILAMAVPVAVGLLAQIAYQLVDLYFIARLGAATTAGVSAASNTWFIISALAQVLSTGCVFFIAHAAGRTDQAGANVAFNQALSLATITGVAFVALMYCFVPMYMRSVTADPEAVVAGIEFLHWVVPGFALMLPLAALSTGLRCIGIVKLPIAIYVLSVLLNIVLAPILIAGWGTGIALGAMGAGLATTLSLAFCSVALCMAIRRRGYFLNIQPSLMWPRFAQWRRMLALGWPAGGEFALMFLSSAMAYHAIRDLGADVQAGFGIGTRVLQATLLPAIAVAAAAGPIAGQNYGAGNSQRVKRTFQMVALIATVPMIGATILMQHPSPLLAVFGAGTSVNVAAAAFLQITSWTCIAQGLIYCCSTMFQGLGNTVPAFVGATTRFVSFLIPVIWLPLQPAFQAQHVWYAWTASVLLQAAVCLYLLHRELQEKLPLRC